MKIPNRIMILLLVIGLGLCACDQRKTEGTAPEVETTGSAARYDADVIRLQGGDWGYPTPFAHYPRGPGGFKMCMIFDSLLERDEKGLIPWLAERYAIEDNGLTYRFTVRDGVHWQDGTLLTAEDVAFSFQYANRHSATWSYIFDAVAGVTVEGGDTVSVRLKKPHAAMLSSLGRTRIIPKHIWEKVERPKEFTTPEAVIGCGPYRLTGYSKEHGTYRFEAFENFWGPGQRVRVIEYIPVSEPILAYENREIDLTAVTPDLLPRFRDDPAHKIVRSPAFWGYRLLMNTDTTACLRDVSVRRALAHAIDRNELVAKIARGAAVPGSPGILPPNHIMADGPVRAYPFDPRQSRRLLEKAGYDRVNADGIRMGADDGTILDLDLLCSSQEVRMAELIRQRLKDVGIRLTVRSVDGKTRDSRVRAFDYQLAVLGHGGWGQDPDYLVAHLCGDVFDQNAAPSYSGLPGLDAPELLDLLKRQQTEIDPARRRDMIGAIRKKAAELLPELPLFYTTGYSIYRPAKYDGWMFMFDHHSLSHSKLSYLQRSGVAAMR